MSALSIHIYHIYVIFNSKFVHNACLQVQTKNLTINTVVNHYNTATSSSFQLHYLLLTQRYFY